MKATIIVVGAIVFATALSANYVNTSINKDVQVSKDAKTLTVAQPSGQALSVYQIQGGLRERGQNDPLANRYLQPTYNDIQGNSEDTDGLQPAVSYNTTGWTLVQ